MSELKDRAEGSKVGRSVIVILVAAGLGYLLFKSGPQTVPEEEKRQPKLVKTVVPTPGTHAVSVTAFGSVLPARRVVIQPQVSGEILRHHPELIPGGYVAEGEELFEIDSRFAALSARESAAALARAEAMLTEARRKRDEAVRLDQEKVIAATDLAALEAQVDSQSADLKRLEAIRDRDAELLLRHKLQAPFNAMVLTESVEIGQRVTSNSQAVTLVGTDEFWVRVALPVDRLRHIALPRNGEAGAAAEVFLDLGEGHVAQWSGRVIRLVSDVEREGRMARVLVSVPDPMGFGSGGQKAPLLIGSYVRVEIAAGTVNNVLAVQRDALREGDRVWVSDEKNELQIRDVQVQWRRGETIYIDNVLAAGESLIVSPLRSALPGMKLNPQPVASTPSAVLSE